MKAIIIYLVFLLKLCNAETLIFPEDFMFGVSTSAYQIEGGWNEGGKGENIWDRFTHTLPERIKGSANGDISSDSYHKYREDVRLLKFLGVDFYRFSISWSRILPTGYSNKINEEGVEYYNNLINELIANNIKPVATLYHWDLPQPLQDIGGWANQVLANYFEDYARVVFEKFGDRVKTWLTFNEPKVACVYGYGDVKMAPGINASGIGEYLCGYTILKAHANAYHLYDKQFKRYQYGQVGIALHSEWFEPNSTCKDDLEASERKLFFDFGWFCNPIFHRNGDYPEVMKERIMWRSRNEGFQNSRLPALSKADIKYIKGTFDFLGVNIYTASMVAHKTTEDSFNIPNYHKDVGVRIWKDSNWPTTPAVRLMVVPWSIRKLLNWIKEHYGDLPIIITENGYADNGKIEDYDRITYYKEYLYHLLQAREEDGIRIYGFSAWTLLDNFEWFGGYEERYGLFAVDFTSSRRTRYAKKSAYFYKKLIQTKKLIINERAEMSSGTKTENSTKILIFTCIITISCSFKFLNKQFNLLLS